jgi:hypothetical protein
LVRSRALRSQPFVATLYIASRIRGSNEGEQGVVASTLRSWHNKGIKKRLIRIKVVQTPLITELDGMDLRRFVPGQIYEVGSRLGAFLLAERWAEPAPEGAAAALVPYSEADPYLPRVVDRSSPPNLTRAIFPTYPDELPLAADLERRKRPRKPSD